MATAGPEAFGRRNALRMVRRELERAINDVDTEPALVPMLEQEYRDWRAAEGDSDTVARFAASRGLDRTELQFVYYMAAAEDSTWQRVYWRLLDASRDEWSLRALLIGREDRLTGQFLDSLITLDMINSYDFDETSTPARWRSVRSLQEQAPDRWFQARDAAEHYSITLQRVLAAADAVSGDALAAHDQFAVASEDRADRRSIEPVFIVDALSLDIDADFARWSSLEPEALVLRGGKQLPGAFGGTDQTSGVFVRLVAVGAAWRVTAASRGAGGRFDLAILFASGRIASTSVELEEGGRVGMSIPAPIPNDRPVRFEVVKRDR